MRGRGVVIGALFVVLAGCGQASSVPAESEVPERAALPAGVRDPAPVVATDATECGDPRESLPPAATLPPPGRMPAGSTMERIVRRGSLVVGVNQNAYRVGYRDPGTGELAGFEIDIVREIAQALFGDPTRVRYI